MSKRQRIRTGGFMTEERKRMAKAHRQKTAPEDPGQGRLGQQNDDCTQFYPRKRHKFSGTGSQEASPSCGWRGVMAAMEVTNAGHQS